MSARQSATLTLLIDFKVGDKADIKNAIICLDKEDADACIDNRYCETFRTEI